VAQAADADQVIIKGENALAGGVTSDHGWDNIKTPSNGPPTLPRRKRSSTRFRGDGNEARHGFGKVLELLDETPVSVASTVIAYI
jgi:hypothetical protein